jgi:hypothetical protein
MLTNMLNTQSGIHWPHDVLVFEAGQNGNEVVDVGRTANQHYRSIWSWRGHEGLDVLCCDSPERPHPSRFQLSQHEVEVKFLLFRESAELLDEDEAVDLLAYPQQAECGLVVVAGHERVDQVVGSSDACSECDYSDVLVSF